MARQPRTLVVGTRNPGKCREIVEILAGLPLVVRPLSDFEDVEPAVETGDTFRKNATAKALAYARATGQWCVADDSGLEVAALGDRPGILSARWGGEDGNDALNNRRLMDEIKTVPPDLRQARYVCVVVLASPEGVLLSASGSCDGVIADQPAGTGGFGYDPYFYLPERGCTMAELTPQEKHRISHRGKALRALRRKLARLLEAQA
jgi:XTP/dITP diphosphohydrolase